MKKKIIALLLATVIVVGAALGGTLAYLTDGQGSVNVATVGNVKIKQFEMQRAGDKLVEFKQGQPLYPAYYQGEAPVVKNGYWTGVEGAIDKIVYVVNEGRSDAYIRTWIALECPDKMELGKHILVNKNTTGIEWTEDDDVIYTTIDSQRYAIICATYTEALVPGEKSVNSLLQVAMAKTVDDEAYGGEKNKTYEILAFTQAVQTKNMPTGVGVALVEAFGEPTLANIPWNADWVAENDVSDIVDELNLVYDAATLAEKLANGESVTLAEDIVLDESIVIPATTAAAYSLRSAAPAVVIDLNGCTISQSNIQTGAYAMIVNNGNLVIKDSVGTGKISYEDKTPYTKDPGWASNTISNKGVLTIKGGTIENITAEAVMNFGYPHAIDAYQGSVTNIEGGTVKSLNYDSIRMFCNSETLATEVNIYGGNIINRVTFQNPNNNTHAAGYGILNITGGNFTTTDGVGANVRLLNFSKDASNMKATVSGGKFDKGIAVQNYTGVEVSATWMEVTGGTFDTDPSAFVKTSSARVVANDDGTFEVVDRYTEITIDNATYKLDGANDNAMSLYLVPADYTGETFEVAKNTVSIGNYAFAYNTNVKTVILPTTVKDLGRGFDSSTVETVILNEGLTTISSRAFRSTTALKKVVFSSTVKTIADNAFQKSGIKTITIPANVETIGETAFGSSLVETVIIEGNTSIQGYAFRGCPNLRTVYLYGDDVTFIASTLNGRNSTWFCNGESNNPNTSNITFYVQNATVAARVKAAMGAEAGNTKIYIMANGNADLDETIASGAKNIYVNEGTYTLPSSSLTADTTLICADGVVFNGTSSLDIKGATIIGATFKNDSGSAVSGTINGTFKDCTFESGEALRWCYTKAGETVVFENCVIKTDFRGFHFDGMDGNVIFRNCAINGFNAYGGEGKITFENCTFGNDASRYNGLNIYSNTVLENCTFNYTSGKTNFIDMEGTGKTLTITNCKATLDGKATDVINFVGGSKLAQNTVKLDGKVVVSTAAQLATAVANGATSLYLMDGEYDIAGCGGKTLNISGSKNAIIKIMNEGELGSDYGFDGSTVTFNGVTFDTSLNNGNYKGFARMKGTYNNCTFNGSYALNANNTFYGCVFNVSGDAYNLWTWGAPEATFNNCTFNSDGKAILLYGGTNTKLTLNSCIFNDKGGLTDLKAAVEIGNDYNSSYELIVNNTVVNGYEINDKGINTGSTLWGNKNSMGTDKLNVVVDGVDVY